MSAVQVASFTDPDVEYTVLAGPTGEATCNCGDWEYRKANDGGDCKHIRKARSEMSETSTALVPVTINPPARTLPAVSELQSMDLVAAQLAETRAIALPAGIKSKEDIRAVILAGWEWGIRPMEALRCFHLIKGQVTASAETMAGMVNHRESDARLEIVSMTDESVTMRFTRPSKHVKAEYTYTLADAAKAGLAGKDNWAGHPKDMMRWAATRRLIRVYAPDLIHNFGAAGAALVAAEEEYEEPRADADGVIIESTATVVEQPYPPAPPPPRKPSGIDVREAIAATKGRPDHYQLLEDFKVAYPATVAPDGKFWPQRIATPQLEEALEWISLWLRAHEPAPAIDAETTAAQAPLV